MKKQQKVVEIMPGCKMAKTSAGEIMFGCPSEVIKVFAKKSRSVPAIIVLPTDFFKFGIVQAALEFPLYNFLFIQQRFFKGERLTIIGKKDQIERIRTIFQLTLLGASEEEMILWKISAEKRKMFKTMNEYFALKNKDGTIAIIDELVNFLELIKEKTEIDGVKIELIDDNVFKIDETNQEELFIDVNLSGPQSPPLPIKAPLKLANRSILGITSLSKCTSGFDSSGYTSGLVLWLNGLGVSVDGVAWMKEHLRSLGINPREIKAHILTHIHDDHSNILDLIVNGQKATIITTKVIYRSFLLKVACLLDLPVNYIRKMTKFVEVVPGKKIEWYGAYFESWYTVHPIPTIGFRVTLNEKSVVYSGDTLWGQKLDEFKGKIKEYYYEAVRNIPFLASEITFFDAGGGLIHPLPEELVKLPEQIRKRMILTHTAQLSPEIQDKFDLPETGQSWEITPQKTWPAGDIMAVMNSPLLQGVDQNWIEVIISQAEIKDYPANKILLQEGQPGKNFYLILGGTTGVFYADEQVAQLSTGDFFGEISIMQEVPCTATIKTKSPVKTLELPREIFLQMIRSTHLAKKLMRIHQIRPILINFTLLKNLESANLNKLIGSAEVKKYEQGSMIIKQGEVGDAFYGIMDGRVNVIANSNGKAEHIATLYRGQCFGEIALLEDGVRTADVVAETDVKVFIISKRKFDKIVGKIPGLFYQLGIMATHRKDDLLQKLKK